MREPSFKSSHRPRGRRVSRIGSRMLCLALLLVLPVGAQNTSQPRPGLPQPIGQPVGGGLTDIGNGDSVDPEKRLRALNAERQKDLVSDANKLLKLTTELNAEIVRDNPDSLSPNQLRKVAEIEKLAHSVKDKMSTSVRGIPTYNPQPNVRTR